MRTTLDVDKELLDAVVDLTKEKSKSRAVSKALEEYVRREHIAGLLGLRGKLDLDVDDWYEFRHMER